MNNIYKLFVKILIKCSYWENHKNKLVRHIEDNNIGNFNS